MDADGDIVRSADQWAAAFVEWDRPVAAEILATGPSAVGVSAHRDAEGAVWLHVTATSPEVEGEAQLTKASATRLAWEITRMVSKL